MITPSALQKLNSFHKFEHGESVIDVYRLEGTSGDIYSIKVKGKPIRNTTKEKAIAFVVRMLR